MAGGKAMFIIVNLTKSMKNNSFLLMLCFLTKRAFSAMVILLALSFSLLAVGANSQIRSINEVDIDIQFKGASIERVFKAIEEQTEFVFVYAPEDLKDVGLINLNITNKSVSEVLEVISKQSQLQFRQINQNISVRKEDAKETSAIIQEDAVVQSRIVSGKVTSFEDSEGIPGANVIIKGTTQGTVTDIEGNYTITVSSPEDVLVFSFVGYISEEVEVGSQSVINMALMPDVTALDEIVVVGYGSQNRRDVTTSIATIKSGELVDIPVSDFRQALGGKLPGVQILQTSGDPGGKVSIRVRGVTSATAGNDPLYIVDGVPLENFNMSQLNNNDIESIEVLKDASSAAIYGSRGSNGVIIITTKKGTSEKMSISFDGYYGVQQVSKKIDMLDAYQYAQLSKDAHDNAYLDEVPGASPSDPNNIRPQSYHKIPEELFPYLEGKEGLVNTNWQDEIFRTAPIQNYNLSLSGKGKVINYFVSGNYFKQDGVVIGSDFSRYSARINLEAKQNKFRFGLNFTPSYTLSNRVNASGPYSSDGIIASALSYSPTWPVYNPDGSYNFQGNGYWRIGNDYQHNEILNPVAIAQLIEDRIDRISLLGNFFAEYEILEGLKYNVSIGGNYNGYHNDYYRPSTLPTRGWQYYGQSSNPLAYSSSTMFFNWVFENKLSYTKQFDDHFLDAVFVYSAQKETAKNNRVEATDFPNDMIHTIPGGTVFDGTSGIEQWALNSYLGRLQYSYKGKYMFSAALRSDGSSRFGSNNRWGYFPSASAGWRISDEAFMRDLNFIDDLKIRGSYGVTGNFQIGNYEHLARVSVENYILGVGDGSLVTGYKPSNVQNDDLSWEKTKMANIGIDVSIKNALLGLTVDYYNSNTTDMLLNVPIPHTAGHSTARMNIGKINNSGYEILLTSKKTIGDFSYSVGVNYAANKNKVKALGPEDTPIIQAGSVGHAYYITQVGSPIGNYYLLVQDGIFSTEEQLDQYPHFANTSVGDFRFVDADKDGILDTENDRVIVGNYMPDFTYGLNGDLKYKSIDLSFAFQGVYGNEILNLNRRYNDNMEGNFNNSVIALDRWRSESEPGSGEVNRANRKAKGNNGRTSTWHLEDGSYLRLQHLTLGYTFPDAYAKRIKVEKIRIYASGQNLITWTNYSGYNPEVNNRPGNALTPGEDYGTYPLARVYTLGVKLAF